MKRTYGLMTAVAVAVLGGCDDGGEDNEGLPTNTSDAVANYAALVHASYEDAFVGATALDTAVQAFVSAPSAASLDIAKSAWLASREPYLQTEVYRFYDGPIDNPETGPEGLLNAWPLDEAYIDYVTGDVTAGVVNDTSIAIDAPMLMSLNEQGEENIATGFHAVEFLLWGQDFNDNGPGSRPYTDYVSSGGTAAHQGRRGVYLSTVSSMLVGHLDGLVQAWAPDDTTNYRSDFESVETSEALRRILTGMIVLSGFETGGERLQTALDSGDQEDEHSCFSDNTHRDMIQDIQGVLNVWQGRYRRTDGTEISGVGIADVVREANATLADQLDAQIAESLRLANALVPPFDQEIRVGNLEGHGRVQALITALRVQEEQLEEVFRLFELNIPAPE